MLHSAAVWTAGRWLPWAVVGASSLATLVAALPEVTGEALPLNDHVYHFALIQRAHAVWLEGGNPADPWIPYWGGGFPVLRYYQHLPHLAVAALYRLFPVGSLEGVFRAFHLLVLGLLPVSFAVGARWLGFSRQVAAAGAVLVPLLDVHPSVPYGLGVQLRSFLWSGGGLYAQEVAWLLFPLAMGRLSRAALEGRSFALALGLLSATWLSHLLLGYTACLLGLLAVLRPEARGQRGAVLVRLLLLYAGTFVACAYLLVPSLTEGELVSRSTWESPVYWDSLGAGPVLGALLGGKLLDGLPFPGLTALAGAGLWVAVRGGLPADRTVRARPALEEDRGALRFAAAALLVSVLLYFGRPAWGPALAVLPFSGALPLHRFLCGVQYTGLLLAAAGLVAVWRWLAWWRSPRRLVLAVAMSAVAMGPAAGNLVGLAVQSARWQADAAARTPPSRADLDAVLARFLERDRTLWGRGHAGTSWSGGTDFKVAGAPVYATWSRFDLSAVSYMYHTMSRNSDLEVAFQPSRLDHHVLFDVRHRITRSVEELPPFASVLEERPGLVAGAVETRGPLDVVEVVATVDTVGATPLEKRLFGERFIESDWHRAGRWAAIRWAPGSPRPDGLWPVSAGFPSAVEGERPGTVRRQWGRNDRFGAEVELSRPGHLLLRMTYHPGWEVRVDGQPVEPVMLAPSFLGAPLPSGAHRVEVAYVSGGAARLWWLGPLLISAVAMGELLRRRRAPGRGAPAS